MQEHNPSIIGCADDPTPEFDAEGHTNQEEPSRHALQAEITRLNRIVHAFMNRTEQIASTQGADIALPHTAIARENPVQHTSDETQAALLRDQKYLPTLQENESYFHQLFELHSDVMLLIDHQSRIIIDANPSAAQFYGYPLESLRGMHVSRINAQPESEIHPQRQKAIHGEQNIFSFEHRLASGDVRAVEAHISTVNYKGRSLFFSIIHDITERKKAETELRIAAAAFESQESMLITDANGVILKVNHAFTETTGYTAKEAVGQTPRLLKSGRHDADFYRAMWETLNLTGKWQGEVWDRRKNGEIYPKWLTITAVKGDDEIATHYVGSHIDITERKRTEAKLHLLAHNDPLTGLPNRALFHDRLQHGLGLARRHQQSIAVMFLDLDHFKEINDTLGHDMGDVLLKEATNRLLACVRKTDTVARIGGDEFTVIITEMKAVEDAEHVAKDILKAFLQPFELNEKFYNVGCSIGIAVFPEHGNDNKTLLKNADSAMYCAKKQRNTFCTFSHNLQAND